MVHADSDDVGHILFHHISSDRQNEFFIGQGNREPYQGSGRILILTL